MHQGATLLPGTKKIIVFLKKNDFDTVGNKTKLSRPCAFPMELAGVVHELFNQCYSPQDIYRATGVILCDLEPNGQVQYSLFDHPAQAEKIKDLYAVADELGQRFGKHTVHLGSSHLIEERGTGRRGSSAVREQTQLINCLIIILT